MSTQAIITSAGVQIVDYNPPEKTPEEIEQEYQTTIPKVVSIRKAELYLIQNNLLQIFEGVIATQGPEAISIWNRSHEVQRVHPLLNYVLDNQGYSELDKDQMFIDADKL